MFRMLGKKVELYRYKVSWNGGLKTLVAAGKLAADEYQQITGEVYVA